MMRYGRLLTALLCSLLFAVRAPAQVSDTLRAERFDGNNIGMWVWNNGWFAGDPTKAYSPSSGLEWPIGENAFIAATSGLWVGAKVDNQIHLAIASPFGSHFLPGPILDGRPANPADRRYRVYKISTEDLSAPGEDYVEWPSELGAPVDEQGNPLLLGEQTLWTLFNDADSWTRGQGRSPRFPTSPLGAEVQMTTFGYKSPGMEDVLFVKHRIVNKSALRWDSTYVSVFWDVNLGDAADDLVGTDTTLSSVFVYNGQEFDGIYGPNPPAAGLTVFKGLSGATWGTTTTISSSYAVEIVAHGSHLGYPLTPEEAYRMLQGRFTSGGIPVIVDPVTLDTTAFVLTGDPVTGSGWIDSEASCCSRALWATTGPVTVDPGQSMEVVWAVVVARGESRLDSVVKLRNKIQTAGEFFLSALLSVYETSDGAPKSFLLLPNYPNPFGLYTTVRWIQRTTERVRVFIYDVQGRQVAMLFDQDFGPGTHRVEFRPDNTLASGLYLYEVSVGAHREQGRMLFIR